MTFCDRCGAEDAGTVRPSRGCFRRSGFTRRTGDVMSSWLDSVISGSVSAVPPRFIVGDVVDVLRASRLPKVEEVIGQGVVTRVTGEFPDQLYWVDGFAVARDARQLRLIERC